MFLSASALSVPDFCSKLCYSALYQTVLDYFRTVLSTHALNPATCFWYSHRTWAGSGVLEPCSRQGGGCPGWEKAQPADPRDAAARRYPFLPVLLPGWQPRAADRPVWTQSPRDCGRHHPWPVTGEGGRGRPAQHPGTLIFFRPRVQMPTPSSIKPGYIKRTNCRHLPVITPDTSPNKRPLPRLLLTGRTIAATKAFSACADDINLML